MSTSATVRSREGWTPPAGFRAAKSAVEGIEVWEPLPAEERAAQPVDTQCPGCAGALEFDPTAGALRCPFCDHEAAKAPEAVGNRAGDAFTREALARGAHGWGVERVVAHCDNCGVDVSMAPGELASTCPFCASKRVGLVSASADAPRPGWVIPFRVVWKDLSGPVHAWIGSGWLHPGDLAKVARVEQFTPIYLPYWFFDADGAASWSAEVGRSRTVVTRDSKGNTRTRTVIDWSWKSGRVARSLRGVRVAGTDRLSKRLLTAIASGFEVDGLCRYDAAVLVGYRAQSFDVSLPDAWAVGRAEIRESLRSACMTDTGSSHVRNFSMTASLSDESWKYALVPVYLTSFQYNGKLYQVMVNGQTGLVRGQKPVAWWRVYVLDALMLSPSLLLALIGVPLLLLGGAGAPFLLAAVVAFFIALVGAFALHRHAAGLEAA